MLQENKRTWSNVVIYKCITAISAFRLANSVLIYAQHFMTQLTLTLKMTTAQVVETSVNSPT